MTFPLERISRGHCIWRVHSVRSPPWVRIGGLPDENPATPTYRQTVVTCYNAYSNALCVRFCLICTPLAITHDPEARPRSGPPAEATPRPFRCLPGVWCGLSVTRARNGPGIPADWAPCKPLRFRNPMGLPLTHPAQLGPGRRPVPLMCVHHDAVGSFAILLPPPTGGRLVVMPHPRPWTGGRTCTTSVGNVRPDRVKRRDAATVHDNNSAAGGTRGVPCSV